MNLYTSTNLGRNQLQIYCNRNACIFEYQISFSESNGGGNFANTIQSLADYFKDNDNTCLFEGSDTVYLKKKLLHKVSIVKLENHLYSCDITAKIRFKRHIKLKFAHKFFQTLLFTKIVDYVNDIGDPLEASDLNLSRLYNASLTQGFWQGNVKMIEDNSSGIAITYDVAHHLTCQLTLLEFIRREILKHQYREDCLEIVREAFIGKTVMTRYNNKSYRCDDIDFSTNPTSSFLSDNGNLISFAEYYQNKYGIAVRHLSQPIIINRVERDPHTPPFIHCLLPEFCYPVYSEWNALEPEDAYFEFSECLKNLPMVKDLLSEWDMSINRANLSTSKPIILYDRFKIDNDRDAQKKKSTWSLLNIFAR